MNEIEPYLPSKIIDRLVQPEWFGADFAQPVTGSYQQAKRPRHKALKPEGMSEASFVLHALKMHANPPKDVVPPQAKLKPAVTDMRSYYPPTVPHLSQRTHSDEVARTLASRYLDDVRRQQARDGRVALQEFANPLLKRFADSILQGETLETGGLRISKIMDHRRGIA